MRTCRQNLDLRECHGTPRYLTTVYSLTLLKLLDTCRRSLHMPKHQKLAKIVTTISKCSLDGSCGWRGKIARHRGCHAWQLLMLTPARPCRSFQSCALPCQLAHNKCHCSAQVESNLLTLFLCGQLFLSCVLLLLLLLVTCCLLLLVLRTLGAASPTRSLELTEPPPV